MATADHFRVLVTGDRHWYCLPLAEAIVIRLKAKHGPALLIVHGAATGVDSAFASACELNDVEHEPHPANWAAYGRAAGPKRNAEMLATGPAVCIACHANLTGSRGTKDMVRRCLGAGVPVWLVDEDRGKETQPKRLETI